MIFSMIVDIFNYIVAKFQQIMAICSNAMNFQSWPTYFAFFGGDGVAALPVVVPAPVPVDGSAADGTGQGGDTSVHPSFGQLVIGIESAGSGCTGPGLLVQGLEHFRVHGLETFQLAADSSRFGRHVQGGAQIVITVLFRVTAAGIGIPVQFQSRGGGRDFAQVERFLQGRQRMHRHL